jgi:hypothetical protein
MLCKGNKVGTRYINIPESHNILARVEGPPLERKKKVSSI